MAPSGAKDAPKPGGPPPIPHIKLEKPEEAVQPVVPPPPVARKSWKDDKRLKRGLIVGGAVVLVLVLYLLLRVFFASPASPPPAPPKKATPVAPAAKTPAPAPTPSTPAGPTPSSTINAAAKVPVQSVNKAKAVTETQAERVQGTNEVVSQPAPAPTPAPAAPPTAVATAGVTELAPGVSLSSRVEATNASVEFRTFVANARISSVMRGSTPRAFINGKMVRRGDVVDVTLGITFDAVEGNQIIFKDKTGATVSRRY